MNDTSHPCRLGFLPILLAGLAAAWCTPSLSFAGDENTPFERFRFARSALYLCVPIGEIIEAEILRQPDGVLSVDLLVLEAWHDPTDRCFGIGPGVELPRECATTTALPRRNLDASEAAMAMEILTLVQSEVQSEPLCEWNTACDRFRFSWDALDATSSPCEAPYVFEDYAYLILSFLESLREPIPPSENGDTNGDGARDLSDAVYTLTALFLGGPAPVRATCREVRQCPPWRSTYLANGDTNGDTTLDLSDVTYLLNWLFLEGPPPHPLCSCLPESECLCDAPGLCVPGPVGPVCTNDLRTCDEVFELYRFLTEEDGALCEGPDSCHYVDGHCAVGLGGCFYFVNQSVRSQHLDALARRWNELGPCAAWVCDCGRPQRMPACTDGRCGRN